MFTKGFNSYACEGDSISCEVEGFTIVATIERDLDYGPPWRESDCHGIVSEWRPKNTKRPGERILSQDRGSCRFYDWEASMQKAKTDGWSSGDGTPGQRAERAVQKDFEVLKAWCEDEWCYCGIVLSVSKNGVDLEEHAASLWGIELNFPDSNNEYLLEVANDMIGEALEAGKKALGETIKALTE